MTHLLHQLRARSRAISHSLLLVLLATWLSMVCPPCMTEAEAAPVAAAASSMPCHQEAPPAGHQSEAPFNCPHAQGGPCVDGSCDAITAITMSEPAAALIAASEPPFVLLLTDAIHLDDKPQQYRPEPLRMSAADDGPLYLRHCSFLN
ncbi:MAG: hypothetical protein KKA36_08285 [Gammaproteobacteria bacterium]|nr:hypothetical protein [Gammaproteobacteria bacterium]MBU2479074.1 hypothetical protein [Gammaproteobacteria bacterium]